MTDSSTPPDGSDRAASRSRPTPRSRRRPAELGAATAASEQPGRRQAPAKRASLVKPPRHCAIAVPRAVAARQSSAADAATGASRKRCRCARVPPPRSRAGCGTQPRTQRPDPALGAGGERNRRRGRELRETRPSSGCTPRSPRSALEPDTIDMPHAADRRAHGIRLSSSAMPIISFFDLLAVVAGYRAVSSASSASMRPGRCRGQGRQHSARLRHSRHRRCADA